jgi:hypothetical protein
MVCANLLTDNANCGSCGNACQAGMACDGTGHCSTTCAGSLVACGSGTSTVCVDTSHDPANCGGCSTATTSYACGGGQVCSSGHCACPSAAPDTCGSGSTAICTDTKSDSQHCGVGCAACPSGQVCDGTGHCATVCASGYMSCTDSSGAVSCVDTNDDSNNCGGCTTATTSYACTGGQLCSAGYCACPAQAPDKCGSGSTAVCTDTKSDSQHCGSSCAACPSGQVCDGTGHCATVCASGYMSCTDATGAVSCVDTNDDPSNCGGCTTPSASYACPSGQVCSTGQCQPCPAEAPDTCGSGSTTICTNTKTDSQHCGAGCSACPSGQVCDGTGHCATLCASGYASCTDSSGAVSCVDTNDDPNNCGGCTTTSKSYACATGTICSGGSCACQPLSDLALCAQAGFNCGATTIVDNCGVTRNIASCGACTGTGQSCGGGSPSQANVCGCIPESDAALCAPRLPACGVTMFTDNCGQTRTPDCGCTLPSVCESNSQCGGCSTYGPIYGPASGTIGGVRDFDSKGDLFINSEGGGMVEVPPGGGQVVLLAGYSSSLHTDGLLGTPLVLADDSVLVAGVDSSQTNAVIYHWVPGSSGVTPWGTGGAANAFGFGLLLDTNNDVIDLRDGQVFKNGGTSWFLEGWLGDDAVITPTGVFHFSSVATQIDESCFDGSSSLTYASGFTDGYGFAMLPDGSMYVGQGNHDPSTIWKISPGGGSASALTTVPMGVPTLAPDPQGSYVYGAGYGDGNTVWRIDTTSGAIMVYGCDPVGSTRPCGATN